MQTLPAPVTGAPSPEGVEPTSPQRAQRTDDRAATLVTRLFDRGPERWARLATVVTLAGLTAFVIAQLHPGLLFSNTIDVGGDNSGHIPAAYYFIHYLLPHAQLTGWDPWWYDGMPLYVFYFPGPAVIVAFFNAFFSYAVAFKLATVLGSAVLPVCAYAFGRLAGLRRPIPVLFAVASVTYLFNDSYTIDGGNIVSTMAGEFSFSIALALSLLFLGTFVYALRTGRLRWLSAILFFLTALCHVVPALFAAMLATIFALAWSGTGAVRRVLVPVGLAGGLLGAFWLLPFQHYVGNFSSSMNWGPVGGSFWSNLFPHTFELVLIVLALPGFALAIWRANRVMVSIGIAALITAGLFEWHPTTVVYQGRWEPFWFLSTTLLAAYLLAELARAAFSWLRVDGLDELVSPVFFGLAGVMLIASWLGVMPFGSALNWPVSKRNFTNDWITFNEAGIQATPGWPEWQRLIAMLDAAGKRYGCGRMDYEYTPNVSNYFGSTDVEMSIPMFTHGCIQSTEGVYYESSTTTHFHFLDQSEVSLDASNPAVLYDGTQTAYENTNVVDGVKHLQLQGVQYFLANSPQIEQQADADPALVQIASTPADPAYVDFNTSTQHAPSKAFWVLYRIKGTSIVTPLTHDPVVEEGLDVTSVANLTSPAGIALLWYQQKQYWSVPIAAAGPPSWPRAKLGSLVPAQQSPAVAQTKISHVEHNDTWSTVSFDVTRLHTPVEVKVPYFPNWQAQGALGPYLATPNLMVVVPTSHHVVLHYGTTGVDWVGRIGSLAGVGLVAGLALHPAPPPARGVGGPADPVPGPAGGLVVDPDWADRLAGIDQDAAGDAAEDAADDAAEDAADDALTGDREGGEGGEGGESRRS